jgi:hypothetical protein
MLGVLFGRGGDVSSGQSESEVKQAEVAGDRKRSATRERLKRRKGKVDG